jgi:hypothetical protein
MDPGDTVPPRSGDAVPLRIVIGSLDQAELATRLHNVLRAAGYNSTLDVVQGADHTSILDSRESTSTLRLILASIGS